MKNFQDINLWDYFIIFFACFLYTVFYKDKKVQSIDGKLIL